MSYTNIFEPLLCISLCLALGFIIGAICTLYTVAQESKANLKELDKFRRLYFYELKKAKLKDCEYEKHYNGYEDDGYEAY